MILTVINEVYFLHILEWRNLVLYGSLSYSKKYPFEFDRPPNDRALPGGPYSLAFEPDDAPPQSHKQNNTWFVIREGKTQVKLTVSEITPDLFVHVERRGLLAGNREGLVSSVGYCLLHLHGVVLGRLLFACYHRCATTALSDHPVQGVQEVHDGHDVCSTDRKNEKRSEATDPQSDSSLRSGSGSGSHGSGGSGGSGLARRRPGADGRDAASSAVQTGGTGTDDSSAAGFSQSSAGASARPERRVLLTALLAAAVAQSCLLLVELCSDRVSRRIANAAFLFWNVRTDPIIFCLLSISLVLLLFFITLV